MINISINKTTFQELLEIHKQCDQDFNPPLSTRVDVFSYCEKLFDNAQIIGAYNYNQLVGIVCIYTNDQEKIAYISSVCIYKEFRGMKISELLMGGAIDLARESFMDTIKLEVGINNNVAISLYKKFGFSIANQIDSSFFMILRLANN